MPEKKGPKEKPAAGTKAKATGARALEKEALVLQFRRGRHTQRPNQILLEVKGIDSRKKAIKYVGAGVVWTSTGKTKKQIHGKISSPHGNSGVLRARFTKALPGTALGKKVKIKN